MKTNEKAVIVTFENYYSKEVSVLVTGTINIERAIKAVRKNESGRKVDVLKCLVLNNLNSLNSEMIERSIGL